MLAKPLTPRQTDVAFLPPQSMRSPYSSRIRWNASPIAFVPPAQAVVGSCTCPAAKTMAICPADIADGHGDKIGFFKTTLLAAGMFFLDRGQAADAAGKNNPESCAVNFFSVKAVVANRFLGGGYGELRKARHFAASRLSMRSAGSSS